jgi:hypothetical protein
MNPGETVGVPALDGPGHGAGKRAAVHGAVADRDRHK